MCSTRSFIAHVAYSNTIVGFSVDRRITAQSSPAVDHTPGGSFLDPTSITAFTIGRAVTGNGLFAPDRGPGFSRWGDLKTLRRHAISAGNLLFGPLEFE